MVRKVTNQQPVYLQKLQKEQQSKHKWTEEAKWWLQPKWTENRKTAERNPKNKGGSFEKVNKMTVLQLDWPVAWRDGSCYWNL